MPMFSRIKISKRIKNKLPMVQPGTRDSSVMPSSGGSASSGLSLDYSALNLGGIDNGIPFNHADDGYNETIEVNEVEDDNGKGRGSFVGSKEEGFELRHSLMANLTALVIKGNAKFIMNNATAEEFYTEIRKYLEQKGYKVSFDVSETTSLLHSADLVIGHSNGLSKLNRCKDTTKLLAFGAIPEKATNADIVFANHPIDEKYLKKCHVSRRYDYPIDEHFIFTDAMKEAIDKITIGLIKKAYPDYPQYSDPQMYTQVSERMPATPSFDMFNTYYTIDEEYGLHSLADLKALIPQLVIAAQKVYDEWIQDEDDDLNGGGICHLIADALCEVMSRAGIECATVSYSIGEVHVASVVKLDEGVYTVDIHPSYYETGGGYSWKKTHNIIFEPDFISITRESPDPNSFPDYINEVNDGKDQIEVYDEPNINKSAFIKSAVTYDSNQVIQDLIKIPQVKALIDQEASGFVDKIIVTTTGSDVQQTQQQLSSSPSSSGIAPITLAPISGNPYGHMWTSEDPTTHQKKPLDKIVRIDRVTDLWGTLVTILHEIAHHRHPDWSEAQVEAEAESHANTVKQFLSATKNASGKTNILFAKYGKLYITPAVECDLADTYQKQVIGLQNHSSLKPQHGLLFTYATQQPLTFWMGKVSFPIDIIFADKGNKIVKIYRNCQPNSQDLYTCANASKVIEVVGSFCAFHDVDVGDHVFYADDREESFTQLMLEKIVELKIAEQKDLDMTDWNVKIVMKKNPDSRRFLRVTWTPEDYKLKKADILVNPNPELIREALKEMPLEKLVRHALLHILAGAKNELPEDKEQRLITNRLFKDASWNFNADWKHEPDAEEAAIRLKMSGARPPLKFIRLNELYMIFQDARGVGCSYNRIDKEAKIQRHDGPAIHWADGTPFRGWVGDSGKFIETFPRRIVFSDNQSPCDMCKKEFDEWFTDSKIWNQLGEKHNKEYCVPCFTKLYFSINKNK